ncbi:helix-turn-helix domain-containing protein [Chryseobacterium pennipullorum]|uniref:XRE family transcriptional regulator n=1 Tax=Chryseobacterium pennipullorum TaxID=2258963 RepID=A0A3D9B5P0_9FLAO|nr:helix-turn-helix transcriptional regulator [Chryseobacterium pennipullorum]REC48546.1 XRE family transcriptional regulator [Chryseobacterium pennipullorum]
MEKSEILKLIGKRIKELRLQKGISQADLVGRMEGNIDPTNISRIEAGRTNPTVITLYRIAEALDIKLIELLNIESSEN